MTTCDDDDADDDDVDEEEDDDMADLVKAVQKGGGVDIWRMRSEVANEE